MWDNLLRIDWGRLTHAYGWARDTPDILRNLIAADEQARARGWDAFWGSINHQGDYYDSTVAAIPFLIEAVAHPGVPDRASILYYFRDRWLEAAVYGGDPLVPEPPGGTEVPTPLRSDTATAVPESGAPGHEEEFDLASYRRMDLCAWQTGRAIQAGRSTFVKLLEDPDREVAAAAAALVLPWPETRARGKQALIRTVAGETDPVAQGRRILEFGVYAATEDVDTLADWLAPHQPAPVRAAAALVWAWLVNPGPLPEPAAAALRDTSVPGSATFRELPWVGVYHRGPWILPANAAGLIVRLAGNHDKELRWRAVQGLAPGYETARHLSAAQVVPVLLRRLTDDYNRIRTAAALALAQRGESVLDIEPDVVPVLIRALEGHDSRDWGDPHHGLDSDSSICGHAARLLATLAHRLASAQRTEALAGIDRALRRCAGRKNDYVMTHGVGIQVAALLQEQRGLLLKPSEWGLADLFAAVAFPDKADRRLAPGDGDRRLADAYARAPEQTLAAAVKAVRTAGERTAAIGAAHWLMTLGPAAAAALEALEAMANGKLDPYARDQARAASQFIRQSLHAADDTSRSGRDRAAPVTELIGLLDHPDACVRAGAAEGLALLAPAARQLTAAIPALERLLTDEACVEVGIRGVYDCAGRLLHWRQERRAPRAAAVRALFALGRIPAGDRLLRAMLAEAQHAQVLCGKTAAPCRFPIAQWRRAVDAAGGLAIADPLIRAARQQCQGQSLQGSHAPHVCATELAEVIRQLSGRLV
jgi:hypothetical protein